MSERPSLMHLAAGATKAKPAAPPVVEKAQPKGDPRPHRATRRGFSTFLQEDDYQTLRRISFEQARPIQHLIEEAIGDLFVKHGYTKNLKGGDDR